MSQSKTNVSDAPSTVQMPYFKGNYASATMGDRISVLRDFAGMDRFVQAVGRSSKQVHRYEKGDDVPFSVLEAIGRETGVSLGWLAYGQVSREEDQTFQKQLIERKIEALRHLLFSDLHSPERASREVALSYWVEELERLGGMDPAPHSSDDLDQPNFVRLPVYTEVQASAGPGAVPVSEQVNNMVAFDRAFLRDLGGNPDRCSIIVARGTSMKPTIPDGAILVVDHSQHDVAHGCIYVFNVCDQLLVKRARWRMDGKLELVSDNTAEDYPVETFGPGQVDDLRVVGRVVYFCRAL